MTGLAALPAFLIALSAAGTLFQLGARRVYGYAVTSAAFEVRLFGRITIYRIAIADIANACRWRFAPRPNGSLFSTLRLGNRIIGPAIVIARKTGYPRFIIVTPDDITATLEKLNRKAEPDGRQSGIART